MHSISIFFVILHIIQTFYAIKDFSKDSIIGCIHDKVSKQIDMCNTTKTPRKMHISISKKVGSTVWNINNHIGISSYFTANNTTTTEITFYHIRSEDSGVYEIKGSLLDRTICVKTLILAVAKIVNVTEGSSIYESLEAPVDEEDYSLFSWTSPNYPRGLEGRITMGVSNGLHIIEIKNYVTQLNGDYKLYFWEQSPHNVLLVYVLRLTGTKAEPEFVQLTEGRQFNITIKIDPAVAPTLSQLTLKKMYEEDKWHSGPITFKIKVPDEGIHFDLILNIDRRVNQLDAGTYLLFDQNYRLIKKIIFKMTSNKYAVKAKKGSNVDITFKLPNIDRALYGLRIKWVLPQGLYIEPRFLKKVTNATHSTLSLENFKNGLKGRYDLLLVDDDKSPVYYYSAYYFCDI